MWPCLAPRGLLFAGRSPTESRFATDRADRVAGLETPPSRHGDAELHPPVLPLPPATHTEPPLSANRPDGSLPQTAISPNECYHSMTRPSDHATPPRGFTIDPARTTTPARRRIRRVLAAPVDARSLQGCVASRCAPERPSHLFTPALAWRAVPCRVTRLVARAGLTLASRVDARNRSARPV